LTQRIYETKDIKPTTRISRLPGNPRKLLSLLTTLSWTDKIIFDLAGVDPVGGQEVFNLVKRQIGNSGAAILMTHVTSSRTTVQYLLSLNIKMRKKINYPQQLSFRAVRSAEHENSVARNLR
jgi:hypothetical protein